MTKKIKKVTKVTKYTPLGTLVQDTITGYEGIAIAKLEYLNGCVQFSLKRKQDKDGKIANAETFDSEQLIVIGKGVAKSEEEEEKLTGGEMPDTPKIY